MLNTDSTFQFEYIPGASSDSSSSSDDVNTQDKFSNKKTESNDQLSDFKLIERRYLDMLIANGNDGNIDHSTDISKTIIAALLNRHLGIESSHSREENATQKET